MPNQSCLATIDPFPGILLGTPPKDGSTTMNEPPQSLPDIDFATFILSLGSSALVHLGQIPDPVSGTVVVSLPLAKQTIDIIGMLHEKTKGNLDEAEDKLVTSMLYDLRIKYVDARKKPPRAEG
ncbi:MAG: DUF1844 domain-containing protein [Pseudomonadota bacterium]